MFIYFRNIDSIIYETINYGSMNQRIGRGLKSIALQFNNLLLL